MELESEKELSLDGIYTSLSIAKEEILKRNANLDLKKKIEDFHGEIPEIFKGKPKAIIFRNIATPNLEMEIAKEYASMLCLDLVVVEYTMDKFCTRNRDKIHLGKMMFFDSSDKTKCVAKENVINIKDDDNKKFLDIKTNWGEDLVCFHHRIFKKCGFENVKTFDASVYKEQGLSAYEIYLRIFSLCTYSTVLLENFLIKSDKGERQFTEKVIIPAFFEVENLYGVKPLIVPLLEGDEYGSIYWQHYSESVHQCVAKI